MAQTGGYYALLPSITFLRLRRYMYQRNLGFMKSIICSVFALLILTGISAAKELPDAPSTVMTADMFIVETPLPAPAQVLEKKPIDATFVSLAIISSGSTFADSYTTLFARQNWLAGKKGVCNIEVQSAYLYGTHPSVGRTYAIASAKSV